MHADLVDTDFHLNLHFLLFFFIFLHKNKNPHIKKGCDEAVKLLHHTFFRLFLQDSTQEDSYCTII